VDEPPDEVRRNIRLQPARRLSAAAADVAADTDWSPPPFDRDLEMIVGQALAKERERRYQSVDALAADLERYLAGEAISARGHQTWYVVRKALARHKVGVAVSAAFAFVVIGALVVTATMWQREVRLRKTYQAGLEMGSYYKLGTVERDDGRVDQAIEMFEKVIEIGEQGGFDDPVVLRSLFAAHSRLASIYLRDGQLESARSHVMAAQAIVAREEWPGADQRELARLQLRAISLEAQEAFAKKEYAAALDLFERVARAAESLHEQVPGNATIQDEMVEAYHYVGWSARKVGEMGRSFDAYARGYEIALDLVRKHPESLDYVYGQAVSELKIAVWHLAQRTQHNDQSARQWLLRAKETLESLPPARAAQADALRCSKAIQDNFDLLGRRRLKRASSSQ
jgi:tetratricopeptide (TPR) repeat protein